MDLRRVLYGLHAILRLHFAQEEEAYAWLASADDDASASRRRLGLSSPIGRLPSGPTSRPLGR